MLQGSRRISCLVSFSVCWAGCTSWIQSQGKLVTLLYIPVPVKKDDDVSLPFFSVIPKISQFHAKSITFNFLFYFLHLFRRVRMLASCFFSIQQKPCFNARFALKGKVFALWGQEFTQWPSAAVVCLQVSFLCISG